MIFCCLTLFWSSPVVPRGLPWPRSRLPACVSSVPEPALPWLVSTCGGCGRWRASCAGRPAGWRRKASSWRGRGFIWRGCCAASGLTWLSTGGAQRGGPGGRPLLRRWVYTLNQEANARHSLIHLTFIWLRPKTALVLHLSRIMPCHVSQTSMKLVLKFLKSLIQSRYCSHQIIF